MILLFYRLIGDAAERADESPNPAVLFWAIIASGVLLGLGIQNQNAYNLVFSRNYHGLHEEVSVPIAAGVLNLESRMILAQPLPMLEKINQVRLSRFSNVSGSIIPEGWPAEGTETSGFGWRISPITENAEFHPGIDITNDEGTPIYATAPGTVIFADRRSDYGYLVVIDHGGGYVSFYAHNSELWAKTGRQVRRGEILGFMGSTGMSTGSHIHYEIWADGRPVDPMLFISSSAPSHIWGTSLACLTSRYTSRRHIPLWLPEPQLPA